MTLETLTTYIKQSLGYPGVEVELVDAQLSQAILDASLKFSRYIPLRVFGSMQVSPNIFRYQVNVPSLISVTDVQFLNKLQLNITDMIENPFLLEQRVSYQTDYFAYASFLSHQQQFRRVFSADPEWDFQWEVVSVNGTPTRVGCLYVKVPQYTPYDMGYVATAYFSPTDDLRCGLPAVPPGQEELFRRLAVAEARIVLGQVRDKFKGIPGPEGGDLAIDGAEQKEQGLRDREEVVEELRGFQRQLPPLTG